MIECNHDLDMLKDGPYPLPLKQRIARRFVHLYNGARCQRVAAPDRSGVLDGVVTVAEELELAGGVASLATSTFVVEDAAGAGVTFVSVLDSQATRPTARSAASRYDGFIV